MKTSPSRRAPTRARRGQTLPLACVSLVFLALMTLLSFNIANVIHEKIRLQNYSDSQAYSMATVEARAFNYLAYSNRASAAGFVTIASLHAFYAIASMSPQLLRAAGVGMGVEALAELAVCVASWGTSPCCGHIAQPVQLAIQYGFQDAPDAEDVLKEWETPFNDAVKGLWDMVNLIHMEQEVVLGSTALKLQQGFGDALKGTNKNASGLAGGVGALNVYNMYCSTEGSMLDMCGARTSETDRAKLYTEIINASRPTFAHHIGQMGLDYLPFIGSKWSDLTLAIPAFYGGDHALTDDSCSPNAGDQGDNACGDVPFAGFLGIKHDLPGPGGWMGSEVYSDENGGDHSPSGAHQGQHQEFKGIPRCVQDKNCFINFRGDPNDRSTWGMPSAFGYYQADLSLRPKQSSSRPWVLGDDGRITLEMGADYNGQAGVLQMTPTRSGAAMSRALVYFHAPGSWPRMPNFFDPFWGSKLHPFDVTTMGMVLAASGDKTSDAPAMVVIEGALPGGG